ncbi:MAG: 1-acylglycerol-3-phosphate O-acyltransferase [Pseudomonadota bacterium]
MNKVLSLIYIPYRYLVFVPLLAVFTLVLGVSAMVLVQVFSPRFVSLVCGVTWAKLNGLITPVLVKVVGRENIEKKQSYVVVSNHQSEYDIIVLYGWLGIDFRWVMKMELRQVPILGYACEKMGHIYIDRSNARAAFNSLKEAKKKVVGGASVLFFPEGPRSLSGQLDDFKRGAFVVALELGLPILPVTIVGTRNILPPKTLKLLPGRARIVIHKPIDTSEYNKRTAGKLIERVRLAIQSSLDENKV